MQVQVKTDKHPFSIRYVNKLIHFIDIHSNHGVKDLLILRNFNFLNKNRKNKRTIALVAFISKQRNKSHIIAISKKDWPKRHYYMCQGILLHEIGHYKIGFKGEPIYMKEFKAQRWALKKAKKFDDKRIYKWLLLNFFLWGLQKNFELIYQKASKVAFNKKIINRKMMNIIFDGESENLDKCYKEYCDNIKLIKL
jgi:hypothetical protein